MIETAQSAMREQSNSEVVGYVEAMVDVAALGWVWRPGFDERLKVELRLGEETIARDCADRMREDLQRNGIGDGRHAFALPIPEAMRSRVSDLRVVVVHDGKAVAALYSPPAPNTSAEGIAKLQRGVEMLIGSQRLMHRNLQAVLLQQTPSLTNALAEIAVAQTGLQENIATFELFVVRLEEALAMRDPRPGPQPVRRGLRIVAVMSSLALVGSGWALCRVMFG